MLLDFSEKDLKQIPTSLNTKNFVNFPDIICIFNEAKCCIFVFCKFLEDLNSKELGIIFSLSKV